MKGLASVTATACAIFVLEAMAHEARAQSCNLSTPCGSQTGAAATVLGTGTSANGVEGTSSTGDGVYGSSTSGNGVYGATGSGWPAVGVYGSSQGSGTGNTAVVGIASGPSSNGVFGQGQCGLFGEATTSTGIGVEGYCQSGSGCSSSGYAIYANGPAGGTTSWNGSDERLKKDIKDATYGIEDVLKLRPVTYLWKNADFGKGTQFGLIAQDVQKVFPELVRQDPNGMLSLNYVQMVPVLVRAVQQQDAEIAKLEAGPRVSMGAVFPTGVGGFAIGLAPVGFYAARRRRNAVT